MTLLGLAEPRWRITYRDRTGYILGHVTADKRLNCGNNGHAWELDTYLV